MAGNILGHRGTPTFIFYNMDLRSACAHGEVHTLLIVSFCIHKQGLNTRIYRFFSKNAVFPYFSNSYNLVLRPELLIFICVSCLLVVCVIECAFCL